MSNIYLRCQNLACHHDDAAIVTQADMDSAEGVIDCDYCGQPMTESKVFDIPEFNLPTLQTRVDKLAKRAEKLGGAPVRMSILRQCFDEVKCDGRTFTRKIYVVEVEGAAPSLAGWRILARIDHEAEGNLIFKAPFAQQALPTHYRTAAANCDHCRQNRERVSTFVLQNEAGELKQVGSSCLKDFLGHPNPLAVAAWLEDVNALATLQSESGDELTKSLFYMPLDGYLAQVVREVEASGWVSKSRAAEMGKGATCDAALYDWMMGKNPTSEKHLRDANSIIAYVRALRNEAGNRILSDYEWTLTVLFEGEYFQASRCGYVASAIVGWQRAQQRANSGSQWLGKVGAKITFRAVVESAWSKESPYGVTTIYALRDEVGNAYTWFSSRPILERGKAYNVEGTVKEHSEFRGEKRTVVTRCKATPIQG